MSAHKEIFTPEMVGHNPHSDFEREPVTPKTRLRIQFEVDNGISPKCIVIAERVVDDDSNVKRAGNNFAVQTKCLPNLSCLVTLNPDHVKWLRLQDE